MSYKVVRDFTDLQDNNHVYRTGDSYPREGVEVTQGRIEELASNKNKRKQILIEKAHKSSRPTKAELAAELTNPELYEAVEAKKAKEQAKAKEVSSEPPKEEKVEKKDNKKKEK